MSAPYSDNLYSAGLSDSENEDESDTLSPSDGYFRASSTSDVPTQSQWQRGNDLTMSSAAPRVPNVLVEDPTLREQGLNKAREAEQERLNAEAAQATQQQQPPARPTRSQSAYPTFAPVHYHRRSVEDEEDRFYEPAGHTPSPRTQPTQNPLAPPPRPLPSQHHQLRHAGDAPPAYSAPLVPAGPNANGYYTFGLPTAPNMGLADEQQRLLPHEPESMRDAPDGAPEQPPWKRAMSRLRVSNPRRKLTTVLGALIILSIFVIVFSGFTLRPDDKKSHLGDKVPVKNPPNHPGFVWDPTGNCLSDPHVFEPIVQTVDAQAQKKLSVIHSISEEHHSGWSPRISGQIILRPTQDSAPAAITLEVISNHKDLGVSVNFQDGNDQVFEISTPSKVPWNQQNLSPCIQIRATIGVPREAWFKSLLLRAVQLDINIENGLVLGVTGSTSISTTSGDVTAPSSKQGTDEGQVPYMLGSREIFVETASGDISGWYPLYDLLKISSASGDINVEIEPEAVDPKVPKSAVLDVRTLSGYVKLSEPINRALGTDKPDKVFPPRDYVVDVNTASGDVLAELAIGSSARFTTQSGDFKLSLWPFLDSAILTYSAPAPYLRTDTKSGETKLKLLDPAWTSITSIADYPFRSPPRPNNPWPSTWDEENEEDTPPVKEDGPYLIIHPHETGDESSVTPEEHNHKTSDDLAPSLETATFGTPVLGTFKSKHKSISGGIKLEYPSVWEGNLWAQTISGSQDIRGKGLKLSDSGGSFMRHVSGTKGDGVSELNIESVSGDQWVLIGPPE
jgi:hypothetical protein